MQRVMSKKKKNELKFFPENKTFWFSFLKMLVYLLENKIFTFLCYILCTLRNSMYKRTFD